MTPRRTTIAGVGGTLTNDTTLWYCMGFTLSMPCRADHWRRGLTQPNDVPAMMKEVHPDDAVAIGVSREPGGSTGELMAWPR